MPYRQHDKRSNRTVRYHVRHEKDAAQINQHVAYSEFDTFLSISRKKRSFPELAAETSSGKPQSNTPAKREASARVREPMGKISDFLRAASGIYRIQWARSFTLSGIMDAGFRTPYSRVFRLQ